MLEELCKLIQHCCAISFGDHATREMLGVVGSNVWLVYFAQQPPTTCNWVCKWTQYVTFNNVGSNVGQQRCLLLHGANKRLHTIKQQSNLHSIKLQTLSMYPTRAVGVWYLSHALKLYVFCCVASWSTHVLCLYSPGINAEPFLDGSAFFFLPAFLNPYVVLTGLPCNSWTKSFKSYAPGIGVS